MQKEYVTHEFLPLFHPQSRILILGTIPSPKSRELGFYYGHPRNRFWKVLPDVLGEPEPVTIEEKKALCMKYKIALWDVLAGCEINGADDASIQNPKVNDIQALITQTHIQAVFTTGLKAKALYKKYCEPETKKPAYALPSTSPANCTISYDRLKESYAQIIPWLKTSFD